MLVFFFVNLQAKILKPRSGKIMSCVLIISPLRRLGSLIPLSASCKPPSEDLVAKFSQNTPDCFVLHHFFHKFASSYD